MYLYAYIEITDRSGVRTMIEKVGVFNDVGAVLAKGLSGTFYVDRIYRGAGALRCQLWGVRTEQLAVMDSNDLRKRVALAQLLYGIPTTLVFGLGLFFIFQAIRVLVTAEDRQRFFYGNDGPPPLPVQAVRI